MGSLRAATIVAATAAIAAGVDLLTKAIAADRLSGGSVHALLPGLDLKLAFNHGISFSLLPAHDPASLAVLLAFQSALTGLVAWLAFRAGGSTERLGLALVTGGALGNLLDRWCQGGVTDWIDLHPAGSHWFTFNLADAWISVGVVLLVGDAIMTARNGVRGRA
ncbi:MAG TPA: signal peptidase II [Methylorubrum populi]|uniref:Lipoprotein signal peptidase n=1 Tax=Methylorubrum populi TaxID=223967 RepID=A0A921E1Y3_9HYPH|nr:signal peptidase II [Methylorubrum populi]